MSHVEKPFVYGRTHTRKHTHTHKKHHRILKNENVNNIHLNGSSSSLVMMMVVAVVAATACASLSKRSHFYDIDV